MYLSHGLPFNPGGAAIHPSWGSALPPLPRGQQCLGIFSRSWENCRPFICPSPAGEEGVPGEGAGPPLPPHALH